MVGIVTDPEGIGITNARDLTRDCSIDRESRVALKSSGTKNPP